MGQGLVTDLDNQNWKKSRALFNHGFHRNVLINYVTEFNEKCDILMENLRTKCDGKTIISMNYELNRFALDVISNVKII